MKKLMCFLLVCIAITAQAVVVDFPDESFKTAILNQSPEIDANGDGDIEDTEAEAYTGDLIFVDELISDLTGLEAFVNLNYLSIDFCPNITELDISGNTALQGLECSWTGITSLDLSNRTFTMDVSVSSNVSLTSVNLENSNMGYINLSTCSLVEGNFTNATFGVLILNDNDFEELDFGSTVIGMLGLLECYELTYLNLNNGVEEEFIEYSLFGGAITADLNLPNLETVCIEELGNATQVLLEDILDDPVTFIDDCAFNGNTYFGLVSFDIDGDGCDADDLGLSDIFIQASGDVYTTAIATEDLGAYSMNLFGDIASPFTISVLGLPDYFSVNPAEVISDFDSYGNEEELNFCIEATEDIDDVTISFLSITNSNPGFMSHHQLIFKNVGTNVSNGTIGLTYDEEKTGFVSASSTVASEEAGVVSFDYSDLTLFETRVIDLYFLTEAPPTTEIGDVLEFLATIVPDETDATPADNVYEHEEVVIGSYDPNDVTVMEGEWLPIADANNYLHYRIRFQNTGTAAAANIRVKNDLDDKLDWTTIQLLSTSHDSRLEIKDGNQLEFFFDNINLIDSFASEADSHGYITYKIKPKAGIAIGDIIESQAAIYFDFNPPVITNIATIEVVQFIPTVSVFVTELTTLDYSIYPVPTTAFINISSATNIHKIVVMNELGQSLLVVDNTDRVDLSGLANGLYFVKTIDEHGNSGIQKILKH